MTFANIDSDTIHNLANPTGRRPRRDVRALAEYLAADPRFAGCSVEELAALVSAGTTVSLPARWPFLRQGAPADALYVLLTGNASVFRHRDPVAELGAGEIFGELPLLVGGQRTATVTSLERVKALRVGYAELAPLLQRHAGLQRVIADVGASRLAVA
jgi:CRP-like cAMP-binding protein